MNQNQEQEWGKKRRHVEVVVFEEPGKKSRKAQKSSNFLSNKGPGRKDSDQDEFDFNSIFDDVKSLGVTGFSKKERKKLEAEKMQSLGARKPKGEKMPYPLLQKLAKKRQEKEKKRLEMEKSMGIITKKKKDIRNSKSKTSLGWWTDKPVNIDKSSNNVKLKKSDIAAIKRKIKH